MDGLSPDLATASAASRHLFGPGRKRVLTLDGGGVRGAVSLAILERLEATISDIEGRDTRLGDWFDLIGGTSTGAIIATALALGYRVADLRDLYDALGPRIFRPRRLPLFGLRARFDARVLAGELDRILGTRTLDSPDLRTGLCIVTKRLDTGSAWVVLNNPRSAFWEGAEADAGGNRRLRLANLVRASTAAPGFFAPEPIGLGPGEPPGLFIDGGLTPHNNPALTVAMAAFVPAFGLCWEAGPERLLVVSVGTGSFRPTVSLAEARRSSGLGLALRSLAAIVAENGQLVLTLMSYFGEGVVPWPINSEVGDLGPLRPAGGAPLFRFARYDVRLEEEWLARELGVRLGPGEAVRLRRMDAPAHMARLGELGRIAAARQVRAEHLRPFRLGQDDTPDPPRSL